MRTSELTSPGRPGSWTRSPGRHLRRLRERVPDVRLFAPRVALAIADTAGAVLVDADGELPAVDIELGSSIRAAALGLLGGLGLGRDTRLRLRGVHSGPEWFEEHAAVGPLQPVWIVLAAESGKPFPRGHQGYSRPAREVPLLAAGEGASSESPASIDAATGGDYVRAVRARIGPAPIFYPWAGLALRDDAGRLFLVRLESGRQWHCPGGGMEIGERPSDTAARELEEETGVRAAAAGLIGCWSGPRRSFPNGDRIQAIAILFAGRVLGGTERPDRTGEIDARGWFGADELPPLRPPWDARVRIVLHGAGTPYG